MKRILVIEDDSTLASGIDYTLKSEGFEVFIAGSIKDAKNVLNEKFDLVLLDVCLPDGSGFDFIKDIRKLINVPVIFLTARDEEVSIVQGLDLGGDDYITKPFRIRELISRIKAVLRRYEGEKQSDVVLSGNLKILSLAGKIYRNDEEIFLTGQELRLLLTLIKNSGKILTRDIILDNIWDFKGEYVDDNTLSVYIRRLREKIEEDPANPEYIVTVRGLGYRWDKEVRGELNEGAF